MGFMDKVKSQAGALAEKAQEGAKAGQERLAQMQSKRQSDALLLELGGLVYLDKMGRSQPGGEARAAEIVAQLQQFEAEHGNVTVTTAVPPAGESGSFVPTGASAAGAAPTGAATAATGAAAPTSVGGGAPTGDSAGGIPTASYASEEEPSES